MIAHFELLHCTTKTMQIILPSSHKPVNFLGSKILWTGWQNGCWIVLSKDYGHPMRAFLNIPNIWANWEDQLNTSFRIFLVILVLFIPFLVTSFFFIFCHFSYMLFFTMYSVCLFLYFLNFHRACLALQNMYFYQK